MKPLTAKLILQQYGVSALQLAAGFQISNDNEEQAA